MPKPAIEPVYLPHNEPYLGQPHLLAFDQAIPDAMRANLEVARRTFVNPLSPLQIAATEIVPQSISLALSIRESHPSGISVLGGHPDPATHRAHRHDLLPASPS